MLSDILRGGFALAHKRPGLILLDIAWKLVWLAGSGALALLAALWLTSGLRGIQWDDAGNPGLNFVIAGALLRQFWAAARGEILWTIILVSVASAIFWIVLEALFRRRILRSLSDEYSAAQPLGVFLASGTMKCIVLFSGAATLAAAYWVDAFAIAIVAVAAAAFLLTLIENLVRADAVAVLGTDLIRAAGLLGILVFVDAAAAASLAILIAAEFLSVARGIDVALMLGTAAAAAVFWNVLHSYLFLVRFSAIAIMRRQSNVVEV